jgi:hypothetical protein
MPPSALHKCGRNTNASSRIVSNTREPLVIMREKAGSTVSSSVGILPESEEVLVGGG